MKKEDKEFEKMVDEAIEGEREFSDLDKVKKISELSGVGVPRAIDQLLSPPSIILVQPNSPILKDSAGNSASPGQFYHPAKTRIFESLKMIILGFKLGRTLYVEEGEETIIGCRSYDSLTSTEGESCAKCKNSKWEANKPPPCKLYFEFMCLDEDGDPFLLTAKGSSFSPARVFINDMLGASLPLFSHWVKATSKLIEGKKGRFYIMQFKRGKKNSLEEVKNYASISMKTFGYSRPFSYLIASGSAKQEKD